MNRWWLVGLLVVGGVWWWSGKPVREDDAVIPRSGGVETADEGGVVDQEVQPLSIAYLKQQEYPGSELVIEQTLNEGSNYRRFIVSYRSEGLKQYALLTVPEGEPPQGGWPAIVFNHGYISPSVYRTTEKYVAYVDGFARQGYVVLKPDYRGHGNSEGVASGGYGSPDYTIDVLNGLASLQRFPEVNAEKIGMWGHSMGGHITLRAMVVEPAIKAGVIWGGVVGSYGDYQELWWGRRNQPTPSISPAVGQRGWWRARLIEEYGTMEENPEFWESISVTGSLKEMAGALQLHHAKGDETVPYALSERMQSRMEAAGKTSELYLYEGDDHNMSGHFGEAMRRSVAFFDRYLK